MPNLDEIANDIPGTATAAAAAAEPEVNFTIPPQQESRSKEFLNKILTAETGAGSVGDYIEHPMNFGKSKGLARVLRGATGIFGSLSLAIIDIGLGMLEFTKERKGVVSDVNVHGGNGFPS